MGKASGESVTVACFTAWNQRIAMAVRSLGDSGFPDFLLEAIRSMSPFKYALMMVYRPGARPYCVHHTFDNEAAHSAVSRYTEATYLLNPVYNAFLAGLKPGIYRITELAPDAYFSSEVFSDLEIGVHSDEELGYRTPGWPAGLAELILAVGLPNGEMLEISLSRPASEGYDDSAICRMRLIEPVIAALFNAYWAQARVRLSQVANSPSLDDLLRDFGRDTLTQREREVAQLILRGHSGESISLHLDISRATVKSHRQNIYGKLNVATQQELFSHFLKSLPLAAARAHKDTEPHPLGGWQSGKR